LMVVGCGKGWGPPTRASGANGEKSEDRGVRQLQNTIRQRATVKNIMA